MIRLLLAALVLVLAAAMAPACHARAVTVAYYDNPPVLFRNAAGKPAGLFAVLIEHTAATRGWKLTWIHRSWPEALDMVQRGEVDLLPDVAYSEERTRRLAFTSQTPLVNWAHVFARPGLEVRSLLDVRGRSVLVQPGDIHAEAFRSTMRSFGITYVEQRLPDYRDLFVALEQGQGDLAVVNHLFAASQGTAYDVQATPILLNPIELRIAAPKGGDRALLDALDEELARMKADKNSAYHRALDHWFTARPGQEPPAWLGTALWAALAAVLLCGLWIVAMRAQVARKTRELAAQNRRLEREIDVRTQAEKALREAQGSIAGVIDAMPSLLAGVDDQGRVTLWNRTAWERTGIPRPQAMGQPLGEVLLHLEDVLPELTGAAASDARRHLPRRSRIVGGSLRYEEITIFPLADTGGTRAVLRVDDVTERVRLEEIAVQGEKMLSLGGLAAGMAHEINNPLGIIMQSAQNALRRVQDEVPANCRAADTCDVELDRVRGYLEARGVLRALEAIREAGARAADIVARMLAFSRPSTSQRSPVDVTALIEEAVALAANEFGQDGQGGFHRVQLVRDYAPDLPPVPAVRTEMVQVLLNLLRNAAQAMLEGEADRPPRIVLRTAQAPGWVRIEVEDNGPGLDPASRTRVFEPFFTTKGPGRGTGLGLSVSYFIVTRNHRGTFTARNAPDGGARFTITLPRE
ncbi:ATP-binding protein [Desulfocurvus vexinensis]|uniref:ATP-binding protein n=1 Tax=Desulfocurvus vexinensis TaxID=399548 RepID=UPI0004BB8D9C|nr:ATP-binding protein [Desulfocurvus vexinensis]